VRTSFTVCTLLCFAIENRIVFPAFLAQYAAGCFLAVAVSAIRQCGWQYLRLMAIVSTAVAVLSVVFLIREAGGLAAGSHLGAAWYLAAGVLFGFAWLFVNAAQGENIGRAQRLCPAAAGLASLAAAIILALRSGPAAATVEAAASSLHSIALGASTALGAALLGVATAGMLLGHRYLTDTDMPMAPLRRLARVYLGVVGVRIAWVAVASVPLWSPQFRPTDVFFFWLALSVRVGVGLVTVGIFAWMAWDCVRRRATQSATALFYLSMLLVVIGELAGQFLMRSESLPL